MAKTFLSFVPGRYKVIDLIDDDPSNNHLSNLQIITQRANAVKGKLRFKKTSKYTGVYWHKHSSIWIAGIVIDGKRKHLGNFKVESDAGAAYQTALKQLNESTSY